MALNSGTLEPIIEKISSLKNNHLINRQVEERVAEFIEVNKEGSLVWFIELVYCLLTAYSSAERAQFCVDALDECGAIIEGDISEVAEVLRREGHRFADRRAEYIVGVRGLAGKIKGIVQGFKTSYAAREWLVENVKGLGWKEASHFLRNVGLLDVAILDRHILSVMKENKLIPDDGKKGLTKKRYLRYEDILKRVAEILDMPLGKMDLYLWYSKTGKVLK